ncbi:MAG: ComF family protein [Alphaproteobacteria bacterium]|jgi:ComF family protein|nr:ComF family protein [Alphaproteobacteria bacterium]MDP6516751.1 ComF family protein [Alphaproteobacteria bacterium]
MVAVTDVSALGRSVTAGLLEALLPPRCMACAASVEATGRLCADCWSGIDFITAPYCVACGLPFAYDLGADSLCAACMAWPPPYARARAVMRYGQTAAALIIGLKHRDRTHLAPALGAWLGRAGRALLAEADMVAPVPLHGRRLLARRYNQSALLAHAVGRAAALPVAPRLVRRRRATPSQAGLSRAQRQRNVQGAFDVSREVSAALAGRRVVLIDDVQTTGATVSECARAIVNAGAAQVDVLTLARVVTAD